jgi:hypothetical protein
MKDVNAILGLGQHDWFVPSFIGYECCRKCGIVRRRDDRNKPCRGRVVLSLRDEYTEGEKE